jgi:hypothetical protein
MDMKKALGCTICALFLAAAAFGKDGIPLRVGGTYRVKSIAAQSKGLLRIEFESTAPTGRFDFLVLETDHVHYAVKEGSSIRLSAEVVAENGKKSIVSQVMVYLPLPNQQSATVWMLSRTNPPKELNGARYLDQHSPTTDFLIL